MRFVVGQPTALRAVARGAGIAGFVVAAAVLTACGSSATPGAGGGTGSSVPPSSAGSTPASTTASPTTGSSAGASSSAQSPAGSTAGSTAAPLEGTTWRLINATDAGGRPIAPADAKMPDSTLEISDGRLMVHVCNTGSGAVTVDGDTLTVGPMAMTMMACMDTVLTDLETHVGQMFADPVTYAIDGDTLTIAGDAGTLTYRAQPGGGQTGTAPSELPVEGTTWLLVSGTGSDGDDLVAAEPGSGARLTIENGRAAVRTGCNTGSGTVEMDGDTMTFGPIATTRMACLDESRSALETTYLAVLEDGPTFEVAGTTLTLTAQTGTLVFEPDPGVPTPEPSTASPVPPAVPVPSELTTGMTDVTRDSGGMLPSIPEDPTTKTE